AARAELAGRSVVVRTARQIGMAQALIELDGLARRLVLCPPDLGAEHLPWVIAAAEVDAVVTDAPDESLTGLGVPVRTLGAPAARADRRVRAGAFGRLGKPSRSPGAPRTAGRDARFRDALALAARADESACRDDHADLCAAVRRDRRPGRARRSQGHVPPRPH